MTERLYEKTQDAQVRTASVSRISCEVLVVHLTGFTGICVCGAADWSHLQVAQPDGRAAHQAECAGILHPADWR